MIDDIVIYKSEVDKIKNLNTVEFQKLIFAILVLVKIQNNYNQNKIEELNNKISDVLVVNNLPLAS